MTAIDSTATGLWRAWGARTTTLDVIAAGAALAPDRPLPLPTTRPLTYGQLHSQVSATAGVLAAQGLDTDAAVGAIVTGLLPKDGRTPAQIAAGMRAALDALRADVAELSGTADAASLPGLFRSAVHRFADRVAVTDTAGTTLTYRELDERSDRVAAGLIAAGAGPERLVGVALARDADLIVALVGVIKTGAAYLPLDRSHPLERLQRIVADAEPVGILTDEDTAAAWSAIGAPCSTLAAVAGVAAATLPARRVNDQHPAYVMYTSGSTGRPKGVAVTHRDVVALLAAMGRMYDFSEDDVWTMFQSYAFDVSVGEIWVALIFGGRLVVLDYLTTRSPRDFAAVLEREQVTVVNLTPSAFYQLAAAVRPPAPGRLSASIRYMIFVGEALDFAQVRRWHADRWALDGDHGPQLNNMYGPTEATVYMTRRELTPDFVAATQASDIGSAIPGTRTYILDRRLAPVPDGVPGELYIAGDQVARGYLGRFGLNATRFVADPFDTAGGRMYATGDVVIARAGSIEYLGRSDGQIKLRGFRIELGEVEAALLAAAGVDAAAAAVKRRERQPEQLVGYVVGAGLDMSAVRSAVAARVPDYMVPDVILPLDQLPLNVNGKLDRAALPTPRPAIVADHVPPADATERRLAALFAAVLDLDRVSVVESLFTMGGNSLLAAQLSARCAEELDLDVSVRDLFEAPTVRDLAARIAGRAQVHRSELRPAERPAQIPLSHTQRRIWFLAELDPGSHVYNIPLVLRFRGDLDTGALDAALRDVIGRHEILRTRFPATDGVPEQVILTPGSYRPDLQIQPAPRLAVADDAAIDAALAATIGVGFDLQAAPPLRARLYQTGDHDYVFVLVAHHVISDGGSLTPLARDLMTAYAARRRGDAPGWRDLAVQYADYTLWQRELLGDPDDPDSLAAGQLSFWRETLAGAPEYLALPTDHPRPPVQSARAAAVRSEIPADLVGAITRFAHAHNVSLFMVLHAAWALVLSRLTGNPDVVLGTPYAGRGERALDDLVGMFMNTVVLRADVDPDRGFADLVADVRDRDLSALGNAEVPFDLLVDDLAPERSTAYAPIIQVLLLLQNAQDARFDLDGVSAELLEQYRDLTDFDLAITVIDDAAGSSEAAAGDAGSADAPLTGVIEYATDLFDEPTITRFWDMFCRVLERVLTDPERPVGDLAVLDAAESAHLRDAGTGADVVVPAGTVADAVARQVARTPGRVALVSGERQVSYAEFGARVSVLARRLVALGVGPDVAVGVCLPRSVELVLGIHAVVAAGGQYVPIDPAAPADRVRSMVDTAGVSVVLVSPAGVPAAVAAAGVDTVVVDSQAGIDVDSAAAQPLSDADRVAAVLPGHAVYTIFTSGSTGRPKGVTLSHAAVVNRLWWGLDALGVGPQDAVLWKTPVTFDCSVAELFAPLMTGARLVVLADGGHLEPAVVAAAITEHQVSMVHFVPSMLSVFVEVVGPDAVRALAESVRVVSTTGEALPPAVAGEVRELLPDVALFNLYGPTEAAVEITAQRVDAVNAADMSVPIGVPVWNSTAYVLDGRLHPVPVGVAGELYVGGVQLARGYAARPDLTAERFVADPFGGPGARLYRTGDLVRWNADGTLEYLGRTDFQVKLRGQRIELGEIESAMSAVPGVVHAAAVVIDGAGGQQLVGYVAGEGVDVSAVRSAVAGVLPGYMVPSVW
ncbi:MAG: amino acid adenylation domain-containing protein, partial [Gordonia sp. (in: high G+C Gram-positive bacteria)]